MIELKPFNFIKHLMRLIRGLAHLEPFKNGCVLTIGNFDGLHLGHAAVINKLAERGQQLGLPVVVMVFEPQPLEYFLGDNAPSRLMRLREKVIEFSKLPVDIVEILLDNKSNNCLKLITELKKVDINTLSPIEAINKLYEWKKNYLV